MEERDREEQRRLAEERRQAEINQALVEEFEEEEEEPEEEDESAPEEEEGGEELPTESVVRRRRIENKDDLQIYVELTEEQLLIHYKMWQEADTLNGISGHLYKKEGGRQDESIFTYKHDWTRRWFKLNGNTLSYGPNIHVITNVNPDKQETVWVGHLSEAKTRPNGLLMTSITRNSKGTKNVLTVHFKDRILTLGSGKAHKNEDEESWIDLHNWQLALYKHHAYSTRPYLLVDPVVAPYVKQVGYQVYP